MSVSRLSQESGAVLVVGDAALAGKLRQALAGATGGGATEVIAVDHYLAVLGEMSQRPVAAVVGRLRPLRSSLEGTVRAMRELEPSAKLLLVARADDEPEAMRAVRLGFDDYHVEPLRIGPLLEQIGYTPGKPAAASNGGTGIDGRAAAKLQAEDAAADIHADSDGTEHTNDPLLLNEPMRTVNELAALNGNGEIAPGDMDLVEQLLRDRRGLKPAAVQKLRQLLGDPQLTFSESRIADARACVPVWAASQQLGYLVSDQVDAETLQPHADWLARWLMLGRHLGQLNDMAMRDGLTGVWNRRYFEQTLRVLINRAREERFRVTLMLFDIDDFKDYNDRYGHGAGDEILCEAAKLMQGAVRKHDVVARVGGDEFAVIFWDAEPPRKGGKGDHPHSVRRAAERFQQAVCEHRFPKLAEQAPGTLTISGGLASFPWDGRTPQQLMELSDEMLLASKKQGKNAITFGPGALRVCGIDPADA